MKRALTWIGTVLAVVVLLLLALSYRPQPGHTTYGMTFSARYAEELGLNWKETYTAMLDDLGVQRIRLPVYWDMIERERGVYWWGDIDFQIHEAKAHDAEIILAVGRRVPRWPECHVPEWGKELSWEEQQGEILAFIRATVEHYKEEVAVSMWQVENEPYLPVFAESACGELDEGFFKEEVALVHSLDSRPVLITDSGNLGTWAGAYRAGDIFGTSVYLYFWNDELGAFRTILPAAYYRIKANIIRILFGARPIILSELSLEPWLAAAIGDVPLDEQLSRMNMEKFGEIVEYGRKTHFDTQYLWGVEWWYYMKTKQGHPEFWDAGKELFQ